MTNSQSLKSAPKKFPYLVSIVALTLFRGTGHPKSLIQGYNPSMLAGYRLSRDLSPDIRTARAQKILLTLTFRSQIEVRKVIMLFCQCLQKVLCTSPDTPVSPMRLSPLVLVVIVRALTSPRCLCYSNSH